MKKAFTIVFLALAFTAMAQNSSDTLMLNKTVCGFDMCQTFEIQSLKIASTDMMISSGATVLGIGCMVISSVMYHKRDDAAARNAADDYVRSLQDGGDFFLGAAIAMGVVSLSLNLAAAIDMRKPTKIKPIKAL
ncbi:MAG: hypothetical protein CVU11_13190 [Bacteroidetes bacterium HGW-Bacteroidetes-6]|jgi:hypothetical protein|nr:MAG: hypothetical protein CVU11_13190 [Bacteroidetes bacterium HGW-Bacteroidetes-6]